jgi:peroxiredoxin
VIRIIVIVMLGLVACTPAQVPLPPPDHTPPPTDPTVQQEVSDTAPAGSVVHGKDGSAVDLASLWADKRVLLVFYMGHWCPHCQKQLGELNDHQADFTAHATTIIAVSTDTPEDATALKAKLGLAFDIYSDPDLQTIGKWGVADYGANVAKPATFIIQPGGAITFRKVGASQTDRPSVAELLSALDASSTGSGSGSAAQ